MSDDDIASKIQEEPLVVTRCSSLGSLSMEYDSESSNLLWQADQPTFLAQGPRLLRTTSLKSELEELIVGDRCQLQSTWAKAHEDPLPSSFINALKELSLGDPFENPLNPPYSMQTKVQESPPSSMKITSSSISAKSETTELRNQQHASSQMGCSQEGHLHDQYLINQKLSRLCCGKCFSHQNKMINNI